MSLTRSRFDHAIQLLRMRGVTVGEWRADAVFRAVERVEGVTWPAIFDGLRSAGSHIPFSVERGVIGTIREHDQLRAHARAQEATRRTYRGRELRQLLHRDVDERGRMRGPVMKGWVL